MFCFVNVSFPGEHTNGFEQVIETNPNGCLFYTGQYTGDGSTSKVISDLPFDPKYIRIWEHHEIAGSDIEIWERTDTMFAGLAVRWKDTDSYSIRDDGIIAFGEKSFTVDDNGNDDSPNENGQVYDYICFGCI